MSIFVFDISNEWSAVMGVCPSDRPSINYRVLCKKLYRCFVVENKLSPYCKTSAIQGRNQGGQNVGSYKGCH